MKEPSYLITLADSKQMPDLFKKGFLRGHGDLRVALVGRSNVGKSSLINRLLGRRLAHVSKTPGKTQAIHFFLWPEVSRIVADLPGYGFAKRSKEDRDRWSRFIGDYLRGDERLTRVLLLLDSRHSPSVLDREAFEFLNSLGVGVTFVLTKTDQLKTQAMRAEQKKEFSAWLSAVGFKLADVFWVSSLSGDGMTALIQHIQTQERDHA